MESLQQIRRYIAEYSEQNDELIAEYDLTNFDLEKFQKEFGEPDQKNPMFDCYPIKQSNISFIQSYIEIAPVWDFKSKSYFLETEAI